MQPTQRELRELEKQLFAECKEKNNPNINSIKKLIEENTNVNTKDGCGFTPLHWAALNNHKEIVELLLKSGADITTKLSYEVTLLHCAAFSGFEEIVKLLLKAGADITAKNSIGRTSLHWAASNNQLQVMSKIIRNIMQCGDLNIQKKLLNGLESISKEITEKENKKDLDTKVKEFLDIELPLAMAKIYAQGAVGGMFLSSENFYLPLEIGMMIGQHLNPEDAKVARVCKSAWVQANEEKTRYQDMIKSQEAKKETIGNSSSNRKRKHEEISHSTLQ